MVASSRHSKVEQSYVKDCADSLPRSKLYFVSWTWEPVGDLLKQMHSQPRQEAQRLGGSQEVGSLGYLVTNLVKNFVTNLVMNLVNHRIW